MPTWMRCPCAGHSLHSSSGWLWLLAWVQKERLFFFSFPCSSESWIPQLLFIFSSTESLLYLLCTGVPTHAWSFWKFWLLGSFGRLVWWLECFRDIDLLHWLSLEPYCVSRNKPPMISECLFILLMKQTFSNLGVQGVVIRLIFVGQNGTLGHWLVLRNLSPGFCLAMCRWSAWCQSIMLSLGSLIILQASWYWPDSSWPHSLKSVLFFFFWK